MTVTTTTTTTTNITVTSRCAVDAYFAEINKRVLPWCGEELSRVDPGISRSGL